MKRSEKIEYWDVERGIGNGIIITLKYGHCFEIGEHVRVFDTVAEANAAVRKAGKCNCATCEAGYDGTERKVVSLVRIPTYFYIDHMERYLPTPDVYRHNKTHFWINLRDPATSELLDDAEYYAHPHGPDAEGLLGLKASARATIKAIRAAIAKQEGSQ